MSHISKRSLKASKEGIQLASRAILKFPTKIDFAVELEVSRSTIQNFFACKPIGRENFHKICQGLDLCWEEIADLPQQQLRPSNANEIGQKILFEEKKEPINFSFVEQFRLQVQPRILSMCSTMRVLDMSQPMSLKDIYVETQVYEKIKGRRRLDVNTIYKTKVFNRVDPFNLKFNLQEVVQNEVSGLDAATRYSKLAVLGKPGSGKTMFLKHLVLQCLEGEFEPEKIPIFVSFRDLLAFDSSLSILNYITWQLTQDGQPPEVNHITQLLSKGKFFIVIDGLDEVKIVDRQAICQSLRRFTEWFPENRYIISCRHGAQYCNFEQFTEVEVADFQSDQIDDFATKWFESRKIEKSDDFLKKLEESISIQEFSTNPLLLTLLCILFEESTSFPSSRSEIYEEGLDIMLRQWDVERSIEREVGYGLSQRQEKELLCAIALTTFEHKQYFFKESELEFYINRYVSNISNEVMLQVNAKKLLKSIETRHGLLVEQAKKVYSFSHLAFQEYLTARKFVFEYDPKISTTMLHHLASHIFEERWREIFLLVAEMSFQADNLVQIIKQQIDAQLGQAVDVKDFLNWINCKAQSVVIHSSQAWSQASNLSKEIHITKEPFSDPAEQAQLQLTTIRAFYFGMGLSQILGCTGSIFDLALSLNPKFSRIIHSNYDLALDLSLFHVLNIGHNLETMQSPATSLKRTLNRAIDYAVKINLELAEILREIEKKLPDPEINKTQFLLWWHDQGESWLCLISSMAIKFCNVGHQWQFDCQHQNFLKQYYQANLLLIDCLRRSSRVSPDIRRAIQYELLLTPLETEKAQTQDIELILCHTLI
jgi:hypothetical protein